MPKILHVDDEELWRKHVYDILQNIPDIELKQFSSLKYAQIASEEQVFDIHIVDGNIDDSEDGIKWAVDLHAQGKTVLVVSGARRPWYANKSLPWIDKLDFSTTTLKEQLNLLWDSGEN